MLKKIIIIFLKFKATLKKNRIKRGVELIK